jgi:hypothetical protein
MSTLSAKDRVSLCMFSFADGRRCRTPRVRNNPHFCFYHAEKEAKARAAENLAQDLSYFFSGTYLSACDLSTAMGRLIPAVVRGDIKPKVARTVAYMAQTLLQSIHISQHEYINAFDTNGWRKSIRNSVNGNHTYRFPPAPDRSGGLQAGPQTEPPSKPQPQPAPASPPTQAPQSAPSPHTPMPQTSAEFVQQVMASRNSSRPPQASQGHGRQPGSAAPNPASQSPATPPAPGPASPTSAAPSAPSSPIQSSTNAQHSPQQQPRPKPHSPVAAKPSAPQQEPRPATGPQTGPSGLPVLATLPPRKPGAAPIGGSS